VPLSGEWRANVEETWEGGRRREILPTVPLAQQFLLANSPVADLFTPAAAAAPAASTNAAPAPADAANGGALRIALGVVTGEMKFDRTTITARAGQRVEITFNNSDDMQHNVVIFKRGTVADYEHELFGSMNDANAQARGFVPDSPNVLVASPLLNARESVVVVFDAPAEPGEYPFVCSFPGQWLTMRGVLKVE
jgi:plastocyanin